MSENKTTLYRGMLNFNGYRIQIHTYIRWVDDGKIYTIASRFQPLGKIEENRIWRYYKCRTKKTYEKRLKEMFEMERDNG